MNIVTIFHFQYRQLAAFEENISYRKDTIIKENYYFKTLDISFGNLICRKIWSGEKSVAMLGSIVSEKKWE